MTEPTKHIPNDTMQAYLDQDLNRTERQKVKFHLEQCPACQEELTRLESLFANLENLPVLKLDKDLTNTVLTQLREESKLSPGITWTLALEALGAGTVISLLIPTMRTAAWLPELADTHTEILAAVNIFLTQLASSWLVWWTGLRLNLELIAKFLFSTSSFPGGEFSPWILILAAGGTGILANYILLRSNPIRSQNHKLLN